MDLKKLWPTLIPIVALLADQFAGVIGPFVAANPTLAMFLAVIVTALANVVNPKKPDV